MTYQRSYTGRWQTFCELCQWTDLYDTLTAAYRAGQDHDAWCPGEVVPR